MKKNYMTPDMVIEDVKIDEILLVLSGNTEAEAQYLDGGDAKSRTVNFSDEDFEF